MYVQDHIYIVHTEEFVLSFPSQWIMLCLYVLIDVYMTAQHVISLST